MPCYVYILHSSRLERHYVGISTCPNKRLRQHRRGQTAWTAQADDWQEVWRVSMADTASARNLERRIKARGAARFLDDQAGR